MLLLWYFVCAHQSNKNANSFEWAESAAMIAASQALRASGGELDEEIESDGDCDEHVGFENFLSSLDEQLCLLIED